MGVNILFSIFYGLISGMGEILPVSASAHGFLLGLMTDRDTTQPLLLLMIHAACLMALLIHSRHRIGYLRREMRLASQPPGRRKRHPDLMAVLDSKVLMTILIPVALGVFLSPLAYQRCTSLPMLALTLIVSGILIYIPHFQPGANRDSRHMSRKDSAILGVCAGLSAFPGISRTGMLISSGLLRGCDKNYILDITLLAMVPVMVCLILTDGVALIAAGVAGITVMALILSLLAAAAAFCGAWLAILILRFVSVNVGYCGFAYYNWGLGLFSFLLYLMI